MPPRIIIGFITYGQGTAKYLPYFLRSLQEQTYNDFHILVFDNTETSENENLSYIKANYPEINIAGVGRNIGFAAAYNILIEKARSQGAEYFLALNPDMLLKPDMLKRLADKMDKDPDLGSVSPLVLKWNFKDKKETDVIDTCGISLLPGLRFVDALQNEKYDSQAIPDILGPSGAAGLYRLSALEKIKQNGQYFDEIFFMYKEDCDLAYRMKLAGIKSKCVPAAVAFHDRSVSGQGKGIVAVALNRFDKSRQSKKWSFVHQQIIYAKFWRTLGWGNKLALVWNQIKTLVFITFFEQYLYLELSKVYKLRTHIKIF